MTVLQTQDFNTVETNVVTAIQANSTQPLTFGVGSVLLAIAQAISFMMLWLQGMILQVQGLTRAATSVGPDLDSWMADFDFQRLGAVIATGSVTFTSITYTAQRVIYAGASVSTGAGTSFTVAINTANALWSPSYTGYVIPGGTATATLPVAAVVAGASGNVLAGSITVITTPIPGVDTVTNGSEFTNGQNAESDAAYDARFQLYITNLSGGTDGAIVAAVKAIQTGLYVVLVENMVYPSTPTLGAFFVVVDDGSGAPSASLLTAAAAAISAARPTCSIFSVQSPTILDVTVVGTITSATGYVHSTVTAAVAAALEQFINTLPNGATLEYTACFPIMYAVPGVANVSLSAFTLNGSNVDIVPATYNVIKCNGIPTIS
jgi:uncharacterized phage protein gp47/JayE